jgi:hypothetical protein
MKWAPLTADSGKRTPLLAMIPTGYPYNLANPVTKVVPNSFLNSWNLKKEDFSKNKNL